MWFKCEQVHHIRVGDDTMCSGSAWGNGGYIVSQCHRRVGHDSKQTLLGVFRPLSVSDRVSCLKREEGAMNRVD